MATARSKKRKSSKSSSRLPNSINPKKFRLGWATHEATKYACENWHYSKRVPVSKLVRIGVWEEDQFIGVVLFGVGASARLHEQFGVGRFEVCELVRIALDRHKTPVSRILSIALLFLCRANPGLKVVASFADANYGHIGHVYQASNWVYTGRTDSQVEYFYANKWHHASRAARDFPLEVYSAFPKRRRRPKFRYVYVLAPELRQRVEAMRKPYPKKEESYV